MGEKKKILAIVPQQEIYDKLDPVLQRDSLDVSHAANATSSLILATNVRFDLIIAEYPLPDLSIIDFLGILRAPKLPCDKTPIFLIVEDEHLASVAKLIEDKDSISVLAQGSAAGHLQQELARGLSDVAIRKTSRLLVQIQTEMDAGNLMRVCQTSNLSESGMLLHTSRLLPVDTEAHVSFNLPGDPRTIEGQIRVVRHTDAQREQLPGMGVQFTQLEASAQEKLRQYVDNRFMAPEEILTVVSRDNAKTA
ncbi:MAG: PilZ domain-containing protein [Acidobacteriota bacterium]